MGACKNLENHSPVEKLREVCWSEEIEKWGWHPEICVWWPDLTARPTGYNPRVWPCLTVLPPGYGQVWPFYPRGDRIWPLYPRGWPGLTIIPQRVTNFEHSAEKTPILTPGGPRGWEKWVFGVLGLFGIGWAGSQAKRSHGDPKQTWFHGFF